MASRIKIDGRIRTMLENGASRGHRTLVVLVGQRSKDQVVYLHNIMSNASLKQVSVLWCYKKELALSSNKKKLAKQIQRSAKEADRVADEEDLFQKFVSSTNIKYCYYKETYRVIGNTYKMCVLQDFEGVTANMLCRVLETVEGGGAVLLLLQSVESLKQMYTLYMDVHARYRSFRHNKIVPRFNERLLQSLSSCPACLVLDDQLRVVEHSEHVANVNKLQHSLTAASKDQDSPVLAKLKASIKDMPPMGVLVGLCKTVDQAKVLLQFSFNITEKTLNTTVSLTAARGRGKSAAMGLAVAASIAFGYVNVFVTSPSPENLVTFFQFVAKGLRALGYEDGANFNLEKSGTDQREAVVRVLVTRDGHNQYVQYIPPTQPELLKNAEILVIDEAAAIPLPVVRALMGPYLVFLSSTVSGYEGTGRSLSLKLIADLRQESQKNDGKGKASQRKLVELTLEESIRYKSGDPVEAWLNSLLCLEPSLPKLPKVLPRPEECQLWYVDRDVLFSGNGVTESCLSDIQSLLVSAHYRNSPDDLQQLSDAPAHRLFVLMPPHDGTDKVPPVLVVLQLVLEGGFTTNYTKLNLDTTDGKERPAGDLVPWTVSNWYRNYDFASLSGGRVLRLATHPNAQGKGYGSRAVQLLRDYYETNTHLASAKEEALATLEQSQEPTMNVVSDEQLANVAADKASKLKKPLFTKVSDRPAEALHYLAASYGVTEQLHRFWKRLGYTSVYQGRSENTLTGEHTLIMLRQLGCKPADSLWLPKLWAGFVERKIEVLPQVFSDLPCKFMLNMITSSHFKKCKKEVVPKSLGIFDSVEALHRMDLYIRKQCESALITDLFRPLAQLYFSEQHAKICKLEVMEMIILLGLGLQRKTEAVIAKEFPDSVDIGTILRCKQNLLTKLYNALKKLKEDYAAGSIEATENDLESKEELEKIAEKLRKKAGKTVEDSDVMKSVKKGMKRKALEQERSSKKKTKTLDLGLLKADKKSL